MRLAEGSLKPDSGSVVAPSQTFPFTLDAQDAIERARTSRKLEEHRRNGSTILISSHDEELLAEFCDEIWWLDGGRLAMKGDPREVLDAYRRHVAKRLREDPAARELRLDPRLRRGDGRAELIAVETLGEDGVASMVWRSGERVSVRIRVRFHAAVESPVVGMMIRTRIGFEVYGTNTELEKVKVGPCQPGDTREITFSFVCGLCPQEYTLTAASHDPDGVWHDWLEDAVAFSVADTRYTAGVANLRAQVSVSSAVDTR
jgi:lipopolysaccharide transport system ATP-binding protein